MANDVGFAASPALAGMPLPAGQIGKNHVLGVRVDDVDGRAIVARIAQAIDEDRRAVFINVNAHLLTLAAPRRWLRTFVANTEVAFCDGVGAQLGFWFLHGKRIARSTAPQWIDDVGREVAARGGSVYWLGGKPAAALQAAEAFERRHGVRTAGVQHGYFDHRPKSAENQAVVRRINEAKPDLLLVNMTMPLQEMWLHNHWHELNATVALTGGALVDHVAGLVRRPPQWVSDCGIEWAYRLALEPRRLARRYLLGLPVFGYRLLLEKVARQLHG